MFPAFRRKSNDEVFPERLPHAAGRRALRACAAALCLLLPAAASAASAPKSTTPQFGHQIGVPLGALATSNAATISGITGSVPISVSGGLYSIGCGEPYTVTPGTISNGSVVCVRHVTPLALGATTTTTLTVNGVASIFNSTTVLASPTTPPATIAAGISHNLVVTPAGEVWGWGDNATGKLGNGNTAASAIPVRATGLTGIIAVAAGMSHSLALKGDGTVWAWGLDDAGQLGTGPSFPSNCTVPGEFGPGPGNTFPCALTPQQVTGIDSVVAIAAGWRHSLALRRDGTVWGWGTDTNNEAGSNGGSNVPVQRVGLTGTFVRISAGYMHSVALKSDGTAFVWGRGKEGEGGPADPNNPALDPTLVTGISSITDIAAGGAFTLARKSDGSLWAWGSNIYGNLGDKAVPSGNGSGGTGFRAVPAAVPGMTGIADFTTGYGFALARKIDGTVWSWGLNNRGQLGNGGAAPDFCGRNYFDPDTQANRPCVRMPTRVPAHDGATRIAAGGAHALTLRPGGTFVAFGDNAVGQLGGKSGNFGDPFGQTTYDPDFSLIPAGTFGTPGGIGSPSTTGVLNVGTLGSGLAFPDQGIGSTSAPLVVTLSNLGDADINTLAITAAGDANAGEFSRTTDCGAALAVGASCNVNVAFSPAAFGGRSGTLTITSDITDSPTMTFALFGTGIDARAASSVTVVSSGTPSLAGSAVTLRGTVSPTGATPGTMAFKSGGATISGCGAVAVTGGVASCATASFLAGVSSVTADYAGDAAVRPSSSPAFFQTVVATPAPVSTTPPSLDFGNQSMNTTAPSQSVAFVNTGGSTVTVLSVTASTHFTLTHDCGTLTAGAGCTATVTFTPAAQGAIAGTIIVSTDVGIQVVTLSGVGEKSLVTHYYRSILRRAPDAGGKAFWEAEATRMLSLGVNVNEAWYSMAGSFYTSAEYLSFGRDDTGFVTDLYNTFFNRPPDAGGLTFWLGQLSGGMPREVALVGFMFSTEFVNFTQAIFGTTTVRAEINTVVDFYRGLLARLPDNGGFNFWVQQFRTAQCQGPAFVTAQAEAISSQFALSPEYSARARDNAGYVGDLYNAFLRRGGDLSGVLFWINQIATSAQTREQVRQQFVASPEFQGRVAAIIAQGCLR